MPESLLEFWRNSPHDPFEVFFKHAPVMMHSIDDKGVLVNVSEFWAKALGYTVEEMIGRPSTDFLTEDSRTRARDGILPAFMRSGQIHNVRYEFVKKGGGVLPVLMSATAEFDKEGKYVRSLAIIFDNTEAQEAMDQLRAKAKQAEAASLAKSTFLATMSHEIRTPLNGVLGMSAALSQTEVKPEQESMIKIILNAGEQLDSLLNDVLDLAKIESGEMSFERSAFDPSALCRHTAALFKANAEAKGIDLSVTTEGIRGVNFYSASNRIQQVLTNLISNALKFTEDGSVSVTGNTEARSERNEYTLRLIVADTGAGVPDGVKNQIFEPFDQGHESIGIDFGGTGLGLAIARVICRRLDGDLVVENTPGGGATFIATMQIVGGKREKTGAVGDTAAEIYATIEQLLNVLVVDDNDMNQKVLEALMISAPATGVFVSSGQEALDLLESVDFDAAFVDIRMPKMNGIEVARRIREREASENAEAMPLIAFTANVMRDQIMEYEAAGFGYSLSKPVRTDDLARCLGWISHEIH